MKIFCHAIWDDQLPDVLLGNTRGRIQASRELNITKEDNHRSLAYYNF